MLDKHLPPCKESRGGTFGKGEVTEVMSNGLSGVSTRRGLFLFLFLC